MSRPVVLDVTAWADVPVTAHQLLDWLQAHFEVHGANPDRIRLMRQQLIELKRDPVAARYLEQTLRSIMFDRIPIDVDLGQMFAERG